VVVGGVISIEVDGGIMELDPAGDRLLLDISGLVDERDIRRTVFGSLRTGSRCLPSPERCHLRRPRGAYRDRIRYGFKRNVPTATAAADGAEPPLMHINALPAHSGTLDQSSTR
jgi:hypothetical protein